MGRARAAPVWLAILATLAGLALAFALKEPCARRVWADGFQYRRLCYNDIQPLFGVRGIDEGKVPYRDAELEYPALTGTFLYAAGRVLRLVGGAGGYTHENYFYVTAVLLVPFAFAVTMLLRPVVPRSRLMVWALGTPLVLYAFHNWDLIAVAAATAGLVWAEAGRAWWAGVALGAGASAKLYPALLMPSVVADRAGLRATLGFASSSMAINLPWIVVAADGWLATWRFHARRLPDFGTVWYWVAHHGRAAVAWSGWDDRWPGVAGTAGAIALAGAAVAYVARGWFRRAREGSFPVAATALGVVAAFLLVSKVHSPQYALWVLPLLALLDVPWWLVGAYLAADLALFVTGFEWFASFGAEPFDAGEPGAWRSAFEWSVWARALALAMLAWWATRARRVRPAGSGA